jgi:hypothetical protein
MARLVADATRSRMTRSGLRLITANVDGLTGFEQVGSVSVRVDKAYFINGRLVDVTPVGAVGEITNVSHVFQPGAWLAASNSP